MRKLIFSILIIISTLLFANVESKGQCTSCPTGMTSTSFRLTLATDCDAFVHYCYDCSPTGHPVAQLCSITIPNDPACYGVVINPTFWVNVRTEMMKDLAVLCVDLYGQIPPCSEPVRPSLEIVMTNCMEVTGEPNSEFIIIKPCDAAPGLCSKEYEVCWNGTEWVATTISVNFQPGTCDLVPIAIGTWPLPTWCISIDCE